MNELNLFQWFLFVYAPSILGTSIAVISGLLIGDRLFNAEHGKN